MGSQISQGINLSGFARQISAVLHDCRMTATALAQAASLDVTRVTHLVVGKELPTGREITAISRVLGVEFEITIYRMGSARLCLDDTAILLLRDGEWAVEDAAGARYLVLAAAANRPGGPGTPVTSINIELLPFRPCGRKVHLTVEHDTVVRCPAEGKLTIGSFLFTEKAKE